VLLLLLNELINKIFLNANLKRMGIMDVISKVAVEIARQVVPDEIYEASLIAENFVKGGKRRKELLKPARAGELGGFGVSEASLLAWIFHALTEAAPFLTGFLAAKAIDNSGLISREIRSAIYARRNLRENLPPPSEQRNLHNTLSSSPHSQFDTGPKQLRQCAAAMGKALQKSGLSSEESEKVAYQAIGVLWEEMPDALVFLRKIAEKK
jgi:hypothetical protein